MRALLRDVVVLLCATLGLSLAQANCPNGLPIDQGSSGGNIFTNPDRAYGGWFWMLGHGNNLLNGAVPEGNVGSDSGTLGGVPIDPTSLDSGWLVDSLGDRSTRMIFSDWGSAGIDGCGDLNANGVAEPGEVMVALIVDSIGTEFAVLSAGGNGAYAWDLGVINNGIPSVQGTPGNGVPMSPIPKPRFGSVRGLPDGQVEVEVILPGPRDIPTYDDMGGGRNVVQGFHLLQGEALLAEVRPGGGRQRIRAVPGERLVLRTIFGSQGDAGFFVDGSATVPREGAGEEPADDEPEPRAAERPARPGPDGGAAEPADVPAAGGLAVAAAEPEPADEEPADEDGDGLADAEDNCPRIGNPDQEDGDGDGAGDFCDACPFLADPGQEDGDGDGMGDACDPCPQDPDNADVDGDGACDGQDNCLDAANPGQEDEDGDGAGDACDGTFDPFVLVVKPEVDEVDGGAGLEVRLAVSNRAPATIRAEIRLLLRDSGGGEKVLGVTPECLEADPQPVQMAPEETWAKACTVSIPGDTAKGKVSLVLQAADRERREERQQETAEITIR